MNTVNRPVRRLLAVSVALMTVATAADATGRYNWGHSWGGDERPELYQGQVEVVPSEGGEMTRDTVTGTVFHDRNRNSVRDRGERGIRGVMVSNGHDVVTTDHRGHYELPAASRGLENFTVFVTRPDGWDLPVDEDNLPQFYYHHQPEGSPALRFGGLPATGAQPAAINFPMVRGERKRSFKIAISGDTQSFVM